MSDLAIRFLNEEGNPVTEETVIQLAQQIRKGYGGSAWLALDEYGEAEFLDVYMENAGKPSVPLLPGGRPGFYWRPNAGGQAQRAQ